MTNDEMKDSGFVIPSSFVIRASSFSGPRLLGRLLEDEDVLPGEEFERFLEPEPLRLQLAADLSDGHLVLGLDRDLGVLATELDEDEATVRLERFAEALQGDLGIGAFVVDVDHQDQV